MRIGWGSLSQPDSDRTSRARGGGSTPQEGAGRAREEPSRAEGRAQTTSAAKGRQREPGPAAAERDQPGQI